MGVLEVTPEGIQFKAIVDEQKVTLAGVFLVAWLIAWAARTLIHVFGRE
jgi:hypothetical protein